MLPAHTSAASDTVLGVLETCGPLQGRRVGSEAIEEGYSLARRRLQFLAGEETMHVQEQDGLCDTKQARGQHDSQARLLGSEVDHVVERAVLSDRNEDGLMVRRCVDGSKTIRPGRQSALLHAIESALRLRRPAGERLTGTWTDMMPFCAGGSTPLKKANWRGFVTVVD